jgi:hypothetical protein
MASFDTTYYGLLRTPTTLGIETTTASFPAYITVISTAEALPSTYYYLSLERDSRFNSADYPTENFDDIETALGITLVADDVFVARPLDEVLTKEERQVMKLEISAKKRTRDGNTKTVYDISELPTKYSGNTVVDNLNVFLLQGRPWSNLNLTTGLAIWYDTAKASTMNGGTYSNGTMITTFTNRATGVNPTSLSSDGPTVRTGAGDTLNGYPILRFVSSTGTSDGFRLTTNSFDDATGWTMVMLAKPSVTPGKNPSFFRIMDLGTFTDRAVVRYVSQSQFVLYAPTGTASVASNVDPDGTWKIITCRYDSTASVASRFTFRWGKTARTVTNGGTPPSGTIPATAGYVDLMGAWDSDFAEQVVYNRALSDDEIIALEDYLSSKWGV